MLNSAMQVLNYLKQYVHLTNFLNDDYHLS